jgi:hypothetical protein
MQGAKQETVERRYVIRGGRLQNETRTNTGTQQQSDGIVLQKQFPRLRIKKRDFEVQV